MKTTVLTRILLVTLFTFSLKNVTLGQDRIRFGFSGGLTASYAKTTRDNSHGQVSPGFGLNVYFPLSIKLNDKLSVETGVGYYFNAFKIKYSFLNLSTATGQPYTPLKICYTQSLNNNKALFTNIGLALNYYSFGGIITTTDDPVTMTITQNLSEKNNQFLIFEIGFRKTTSKNKIHQISLQYFHGLQKVENGTAFHLSNPSDTFKYSYSGHFATIQYTFWLGKKSKDV